ncbi:hypothetical protein [Microbacterium hydrocarbonoxydans]|uniref:hypothetical protein n=1 Tax=Microbacterium hydrocarbonoxydans TaxID=273678 RepID=UPI001FBB72FD|nr:hypothetical protein [Microbacterium hydrocarbonoxydans]
MTLKTRNLALILAAAAALSLSLAACSPAAEPTSSPAPETSEASDGSCAGVTVIVDTGNLEVEDDPSLETCVETDEPISGPDALAEAELTTVGTVTYPDDVVCRVNGVPSEETELPGADGAAYHETCADMPSANAYWSLWVKPAEGEWDYAQTGLSGLELNPGDSVELLFTLNGEPAAPAPTS